MAINQAIVANISRLRTWNRQDRDRLISNFNNTFNSMFYGQELIWKCTASKSMGESVYKHAKSTWLLRSGFKITIENDRELTSDSMREIAESLLSNVSYVSDLMNNGFDTLVVFGMNTKQELKYSISKYFTQK